METVTTEAESRGWVLAITDIDNVNKLECTLIVVKCNTGVSSLK